jgi:hypothetical protein
MYVQLLRVYVQWSMARTRLDLRVPEDWLARVDAWAKQRGVTRTELIVGMVAAQLPPESKAAVMGPATFHQEQAVGVPMVRCEHARSTFNGTFRMCEDCGEIVPR